MLDVKGSSTQAGAQIIQDAWNRNDNQRWLVPTLQSEAGLFVFHQGYDGPGKGNGQLWYNVFDGSRWAGDTQVPNLGMSGSPSAVVFNGKLGVSSMLRQQMLGCTVVPCRSEHHRRDRRTTIGSLE